MSSIDRNNIEALKQRLLEPSNIILSYANILNEKSVSQSLEEFDDELNKIVDMISTRFNSRKLSPEWNDWRDSLPNIFTEKSVGKLSWFEDGDGVPESVSMIEEKETKINEGCAVIIIQDGNFKAEYANVPSDVALTINAELSKALS